jgi:predicted polyphosphate/ATP-dependent NAD kinase
LGKTCTTVGIIANPLSGGDIRRLVSRASVFSTAEKANMVQRMLGAMGALGVDRVLMMPDVAGICAAMERAEHDRVWPMLEYLDMEVEESSQDTVEAVTRMVTQGVRAIVVLGGDGTHRAVATRCGDVPLATLSSGTNNVFPDLREATVTGMAAALVALGRVPAEAALRRQKVLRIASNLPDRRGEIALVDACISSLRFLGARALWQPETLSELVVAFAEPDAIGLSSIAGLLHPVSREEPHGLYLRLAAPRSPMAAVTIAAPIAPGVLGEVGVAAIELLIPGRPRWLDTAAGTIAFDGEREIEFGPNERFSVALDPDGPWTIDVQSTLSWAARNGTLRAGR